MHITSDSKHRFCNDFTTMDKARIRWQFDGLIKLSRKPYTQYTSTLERFRCTLADRPCGGDACTVRATRAVRLRGSAAHEVWEASESNMGAVRTVVLFGDRPLPETCGRARPRAQGHDRMCMCSRRGQPSHAHARPRLRCKALRKPPPLRRACTPRKTRA